MTKTVKKVFIYQRFSHWSEYINEAKHKSLEGQKVAIHHGEEVLGEGMLLSYKKVTDPASNSLFITCEIVTKEGEQSFFGENLEVIPQTQW
ncbi:MAG: hypothetical protein LRY73_10185 [Bacillus sp. (in: Bacteria)]|nr:hypothetical protein [Bacillus sp. (in: firmicutes)]